MSFAFTPQSRARGEHLSDLWIQQNIPGGLNSPLGRRIDEHLGGNPNPTFGQTHGIYPQPYGGYNTPGNVYNAPGNGYNAPGYGYNAPGAGYQQYRGW